MRTAEHIEPDVDLAPRMWCCECKRRTFFRYDQFGYPYCIEHTEEEIHE